MLALLPARRDEKATHIAHTVCGARNSIDRARSGSHRLMLAFALTLASRRPDPISLQAARARRIQFFRGLSCQMSGSLKRAPATTIDMDEARPPLAERIYKIIGFHLAVASRVPLAQDCATSYLLAGRPTDRPARLQLPAPFIPSRVRPSLFDLRSRIQFSIRAQTSGRLNSRARSKCARSHHRRRPIKPEPVITTSRAVRAKLVAQPASAIIHANNLT